MWMGRRSYGLGFVGRGFEVERGYPDLEGAFLREGNERSITRPLWTQGRRLEEDQDRAENAAPYETLYPSVCCSLAMPLVKHRNLSDISWMSTSRQKATTTIHLPLASSRADFP